MADHDTTISAETFAKIRASPNCLSWKRAGDLPKHLRIRQGMCATTTGSPSVELSYSAVFPPADTPLRGVVLFIHGVNEHSERYFHVFEALCEMGFGAIAYDLRSHGKSHKDARGLVAHADHFREFIDDTNDFLDFAKCEIYPLMDVRPDEKLVIMAMSMGTLVSVLTVLSERHKFAGIVLAAPAVSVEMTPCLNLMASAGCVLSTLLPRARLVPGVNRKWLSREPLWNSDYDSDPLTTRKPITCRMGHDTRRHMVALQRDMRVEDPSSAFCATPILLLMGTQDRVTSLPVAQGFYDRLANHDKHFELIDGAYHVLFEDYKRAHVMSTIQQWLHKRFPAPARGSTLQRTT